MNFLTSSELKELEFFLEQMNDGPYGELSFNVSVGDANGEPVGTVTRNSHGYVFNLLGTE